MPSASYALSALHSMNDPRVFRTFGKTLGLISADKAVCYSICVPGWMHSSEGQTGF